jgi:hypothetical protein
MPSLRHSTNSHDVRFQQQCHGVEFDTSSQLDDGKATPACFLQTGQRFVFNLQYIELVHVSSSCWYVISFKCPEPSSAAIKTTSQVIFQQCLLLVNHNKKNSIEDAIL